MGTRDIFIVGHGTTKTNRMITVPEKCEVRFYVVGGCKMNEGDIRSMLQNGAIKCGDNDKGEDPVEIYRERQAMNDMTLRPHAAAASRVADRSSFMRGKKELEARGIHAQLLVPWAESQLKEHADPKKPHVLVKNPKNPGEEEMMIDLSLSWIFQKVLKHRGALKNEGYDSFRFHWLCCRGPNTAPPKQPVAVTPSKASDPDNPFADIELITF